MSAFDSRKALASRRGVTLFEVLIVVAILALVAGSVGAAAVVYYEKARRKTTETNARAVRGAVKLWWVDHDERECPKLDQLIADGSLDRDSARRDAWGESWRVECVENEVVVTSAGADRKLGTADDIRVPPA